VTGSGEEKRKGGERERRIRSRGREREETGGR